MQIDRPGLQTFTLTGFSMGFKRTFPDKLHKFHLKTNLIISISLQKINTYNYLFVFVILHCTIKTIQQRI